MPFDVGFDPLVHDQQQQNGGHRNQKFPIVKQRMSVRH
jgi:hypothetical protein